MARPIFSEKEFEVIGSYPGLKSVQLLGIMSGIDGRVAFPKRNRPITPYENWKLLLTGKKPYWIPRYGFVCGDDDIVGFRPRENSDNIANHQVFDGGEYYDYVGLGNIIYSAWFDLGVCPLLRRRNGTSRRAQSKGHEPVARDCQVPQSG